MDLEEFFISRGFVAATALTLTAIAVSVAGIGYRRLAVALTAVFVGALACALVAGLVAAVIAARVAGHGEGSGVAAVLFVLATVVAAWIVTLLGGLTWVFLRIKRYNARHARNAGLLGVGAGCAAVALVLIGVQVVASTPRLQSDAALVRQAGGYDGVARGDAQSELVGRGQESVPELVASLRATPHDQLVEFESGLNTPVIERLRLLGALGGPEAIAELRQWLNSEYAADVRGAAAAALGAAGDKESISAIAALLENDQYEWKSQRSVLVHALGQLDAETEVDRIRAAMQFTPDERGSSYQIMLVGTTVQALAAVDTPEAWAAIRDLGHSDDAYQNDAVQRTLEALGKAMPEM